MSSRKYLKFKCFRDFFFLLNLKKKYKKVGDGYIHLIEGEQTQ